MHNFNEKHPHVIENVGCRCKICEGSILKSKKRQDVDAIYIVDRMKKHLQVQRKSKLQIRWSPKRASAIVNIKVLQIHRSKKSICNGE